MFENVNAARDVLYSLARHCQIGHAQLKKLFEQEGVYTSRQHWFLFLEWFLLALGAVLTAAGVIYFFAYNWAEMHKFVKLGLLQSVVLLLVGLVLWGRFDAKISKVLLTLAAVMVGVLFAVFGQIYQTGANAYDFFQGWALAIFLWALAGRSGYLWLLFLVLVNLTLHFYAAQVAHHTWPSYLLPVLLFLINSAAVALWELLWTKGKISTALRWFPALVALAAITINTMGQCSAIFRGLEEDKGLSLFITACVYALGFWYGLRQQRMFYPAALGFSLIIIGTCSLVKLLEHADDEGILLLSSMFVIGTTSALAFYLKHLNGLWYERK